MSRRLLCHLSPTTRFIQKEAGSENKTLVRIKVICNLLFIPLEQVFDYFCIYHKKVGSVIFQV